MTMKQPNFPVIRAWLSRLGAGFLLLAVSACASTRGDNIAYDVQDFGQPDAPSQTSLQSDYHIAPLDKLSVNVFQVDALSGEYQVDLTGNIALPLLGNVKAIDMTPVELQEDLKTKLAAKYLNNPDVTVGVLAASGSQVTVEGSVKNPGLYPLYGKKTLIQVVAESGGLDDLANPKRVAIFRQIDGQRQAAAFDLTTIRSGQDPDPQVFRGDIIVVDGSKTKQTWRNMIMSVPLFTVFRPFGF